MSLEQLKNKFFRHHDETTFWESYLPLSFFLNKIFVQCPYCANLAQITTDIPPLAQQEKVQRIFYDGPIEPYFSPTYHKYTQITFLCLHCQKHIKADNSHYQELVFIKKYWWGPIQAYAELTVCPSCHSREKMRMQQTFDSLPQLPKTHEFICSNCQARSCCPISYRRAWLTSKLQDPIFGLSLWLSAAIKQQTIWLYNMEHLQVMRMYITAKHHKEDFIVDSVGPLDYRNMKNNTMTFSRNLPQWIKMIKNRQLILSTLDKLEIKLKKDLAL